MAYKTNSASKFNFDTTVTINGITYDLLKLDSPIIFDNEAGHWNIEVSRSEATDTALDGNVDVTSSKPTEADTSLNSAASVDDTGLTDVTEPTADVAEPVTDSDETNQTSEPTVVSEADLLVSTSDKTVCDPATTLGDDAETVTADDASNPSQPIVADADVTSTVIETPESPSPVVDDEETVATGVDADAATTVEMTEVTETTVTEEPATDDVTSVEVDDTTSEVTAGAEEVDADLSGGTAETDLTASGDDAQDFGHRLASWLADLDTLAFDSDAGTPEPDVNALLPQYADAIADVLGELQTCLATHEASVDPVAAEAVSDYLAGIQSKIASVNDGPLI
jgi:hypothetical protein